MTKTIETFRAYCSLDKKAYYKIWTECIDGRDANASVLLVIRVILKYHQLLNSIILWPDSCVPHNRNFVISLALKILMSQNHSINKIVQNYFTPGHSSIEKVDIIHITWKRASE